MDPQSEALRFRLRMTPGQSVEDDKGCVIPAPLPSFPRKRESRLNGSRIKCGMTGGDGSRIKCGMTGGDDKEVE